MIFLQRAKDILGFPEEENIFHQLHPKPSIVGYFNAIPCSLSTKNLSLIRRQNICFTCFSHY